MQGIFNRSGEEEGTVKYLAEELVPITKAYKSAQRNTAVGGTATRAGRRASVQQATG